jgi:transposase
MFKYRSEKRDKEYGLVTDMYFKEGVSITTISKKISTPRATIRRWLRNFADENHIEMVSKKYCKRLTASLLKPAMRVIQEAMKRHCSTRSSDWRES